MQAENLPSSVRKSVETSKICQELIRKQPGTSHYYSMELKPGTAWIKFPDNSILRRTRFMIKPRSQSSHLKWKLKAKEWNSTGNISSHFHQPFNSKLTTLELPALSVDNPVPPPLTSRVALSVQVNIPVSSTGEVQPSIINSDPVIPITPQRSTHSTKGIPTVRGTPSKK